MEGGLKNKNFLFRNYGEKVILKSAIKLTSHTRIMMYLGAEILTSRG